MSVINYDHYSAHSINLLARLTYVTPKKCQTYELENTREHREALRQIAVRIENFLALSEDPDFFKSITVPDLDSFLLGWPREAARLRALADLNSRSDRDWRLLRP
jgi:hypothetical protein